MQTFKELEKMNSSINIGAIFNEINSRHISKPAEERGVYHESRQQEQLSDSRRKDDKEEKS